MLFTASHIVFLALVHVADVSCLPPAVNYVLGILSGHSNEIPNYCTGTRKYDGSSFYDANLGDPGREFCPNISPIAPYPDNIVQKKCDICCRNAGHAQDIGFSHAVTAKLEDRCKANIRSATNQGFRCKC